MKKEQWNKLKYFTENENWGDPEFMDYSFLKRLERFRKYMKTPFIIHNAYETQGHATDSQHYKIPTKCVDGHFKGYDISLLDLYIEADRFGFTGIGLYPNKGKHFIHLDTRGLSKNKGRGSRWVRDDSGVYHSLNAESLKKYILGGN